MTDQVKRLLFEIYGLFRIVLGIAQLIGLFFAYFLLEVTLNYPAAVTVYTLDQDMVALVYLAIVMRGGFHLVSGIGILRCSMWAAWWLRAGWPLICLINVGLAQTFYFEWMKSGRIDNIFSALSPAGVALMIVWVCLDMFVVSRWAGSTQKQYNSSFVSMPAAGISGIVVGAIVLFSLLFFFGRGVKQGFHRGFYKVRATHTAPQTALVERNAPGPAVTRSKAESRVKPPLKNGGQLSTPTPQAEAGHEIMATVKPGSGLVKNIVAESRELPYKEMIVIFAAVFFVSGLATHVYKAWKEQHVSGWSWNSLILLSVSFLLLMLYGLIVKIFLWTVLGMASFLLIGTLCAIKTINY